MEPNRKALVLGATGGIGGAIAAALVRHGWSVQALARNPAAARNATPSAAIRWIEGDAMNRADVMRAAEGASLIVHAVNPPNYANWDTLVLPMIDNTIAAARATGARIVLPGTIYNYDPEKTPVVSADTKQEPKSRKGVIRVALERRLRDAAPQVPSLILRAGDFFGPGARSSWFSQAMVSPGKPVRRIVDPARGPGHSWAYLPDLAETFARLADMEDRLAQFEVLQFEGTVDTDGTRMIEAIRAAAGRRVPVYRFPWWLVRLAAPFNGFMREAAEIAPGWKHPMRLDNTRLIALLGEEPHTPLDVAMPATLAAMGCLPAAAPARPDRRALAGT